MSAYRTRVRRRRPHTLVADAVCVTVLVASAFAVRAWLVAPFSVPSASMAPTLRAGELILADRTRAGQAHRGDVVVFDGTGYFGGPDSHATYWVKRVIGVGGDRVSCCDDAGAITINGQALDELYLAPGTQPSRIRFDVEVPTGHLFLLGDNRADSTDSRSLLGAPGGGMVPVERVVGPVTRVIWPPGRARSLPPGDAG